MRWLHRGTFPSSKPLGIISRWLPLAMSWPSCGAICGAIFFFPHLPRTPMWFYYLVRRSRSWLMRCVTELNRTKSSLGAHRRGAPAAEASPAWRACRCARRAYLAASCGAILHVGFISRLGERVFHVQPLRDKLLVA